MPRLPSDKAQLNVIVSRKLLNELKKLISWKHGEYRKGLLSQEVEEALWCWVRMHTQKHTNSTDEPPVKGGKIEKVWDRIRQLIKEKYGFMPQQISRRDLEWAIAEVRGGDKRTISKWIRLFLQYKYIDTVNPSVFKILR